MAEDVNYGNAVSQKVGPLPLWQWAVIGIGAYVIYKHFRPAAASTGAVSTNGGSVAIDPATGQPVSQLDYLSGLIGSNYDLSNQLGILDSNVAANTGGLGANTTALSGNTAATVANTGGVVANTVATAKNTGVLTRNPPVSNAPPVLWIDPRNHREYAQTGGRAIWLQPNQVKAYIKAGYKPIGIVTPAEAVQRSTWGVGK
jgi:hypothetical protein